MEVCSNFGLSSVSIRKQLLFVIEKFFPCFGREFLVLGWTIINVTSIIDVERRIDSLSTIASTGQAS
jgi:hypothetical protein